jgi:hypothetical protein
MEMKKRIRRLRERADASFEAAVDRGLEDALGITPRRRGAKTLGTLPKKPQAQKEWEARCAERARRKVAVRSKMTQVGAQDQSRRRRRVMVVFGD